MTPVINRKKKKKQQLWCELKVLRGKKTTESHNEGVQQHMTVRSD